MLLPSKPLPEPDEAASLVGSAGLSEQFRGTETLTAHLPPMVHGPWWVAGFLRIWLGGGVGLGADKVQYSRKRAAREGSIPDLKFCQSHFKISAPFPSHFEALGNTTSSVKQAVESGGI